MSVTWGASAYIDVADYLRAATNVETASLLGLNTVLGGMTAVPSWLLDGPYSEKVQVTGALDGKHLTLAAPGTLFAHAPGVSATQAGSSGALAELLLRASAWIASYCRHDASAGDRSLLAVSRSERWGMPGTRAWLDRDRVLCLRPGHFPVQSVATLALESAPGDALSLDIARIELASSERLVEIPLAADPLQSGPLTLAREGLSHRRRQWVVTTYLHRWHRAWSRAVRRAAGLHLGGKRDSGAAAQSDRGRARAPGHVRVAGARP
ncbi:MAG TPA: hypothetical protein VGP82_09845 [Ktedonobacterales bacterium]|jgi:hypothetical protein|nr:hypothetical protein [Ktedonobacterales bacterium]